jgi:imidazolonepropionase-like amidohydrolase
MPDGPGRSSAAVSVAITGVTVIDCSGAPASPDSTVLTGGDSIVAVGPTGDVEIPAGSRVVDGRGRFLIPGLWDMHGHLTDATEDASRTPVTQSPRLGRRGGRFMNSKPAVWTSSRCITPCRARHSSR